MKQTNYELLTEEIENLAEHIKVDDLDERGIIIYFENCTDTEDYIDEILALIQSYKEDENSLEEITNIKFVEGGILISFYVVLELEDSLEEEPETEWDKDDRIYHEAKDRRIEE